MKPLSVASPTKKPVVVSVSKMPVTSPVASSPTKLMSKAELKAAKAAAKNKLESDKAANAADSIIAKDKAAIDAIKAQKKLQKQQNVQAQSGLGIGPARPGPVLG